MNGWKHEFLKLGHNKSTVPVTLLQNINESITSVCVLSVGICAWTKLNI